MVTPPPITVFTGGARGGGRSLGVGGQRVRERRYQLIAADPGNALRPLASRATLRALRPLGTLRPGGTLDSLSPCGSRCTVGALSAS